MSRKLPIDVPYEKINGFCEKWQVTEFALFGSVLRDDFSPDSGIDVLVKFSEDAIPSACSITSICKTSLKASSGVGWTLLASELLNRAATRSDAGRFSAPRRSSMPQRDLLYLHDILIAAKNVIEFTRNIDRKIFEDGVLLHSGVIRQIEIIGEATKRLSQDLRQKYPDVPWQKMAGMRDIFTRKAPKKPCSVGSLAILVSTIRLSPGS